MSKWKQNVIMGRVARKANSRTLFERMERRELLSAATADISLGAKQGITATATDLGDLHMSSTAKVAGSVGSTSTHAVYKVNVTDSINLGITLTKLVQNDQVHLLYADGTNVTNGWQNTQSKTLKISQRVDPGTYYVDVSHGIDAQAGLLGASVSKVKKYHLKSLSGFALQLKGLKADNTIAPTEPVNPTKFSAVFGGTGANAEPTISANLTANSGFDHFQSFTTGYQLWGTAGPQPDDIEQQALGDCYFMSILSDIARSDPGLIEKTIIPQDNGNYLVKFFQNGQEFDQTVDPKFPVNASGHPVFANIPDNHNIWVPVLEKAWCYFRPNSTQPNSYDGIEYGLPSESLKAFSSTDANETLATSFNSAPQLLSTMSKELTNGMMLDIGTNSPQNWPGESTPLPSGLFVGHAYSIVSVDTTAGNVKLRNPWATNSFGGNDNSGGYITITGDQLIQSINILTQGTVPTETPTTVDPTPTPNPTPTPTPQPTTNNTQVLQEQLGPKSFLDNTNKNYDVFSFTANTSGTLVVSIESTSFIPELLVAEVGQNGSPTSIGTDANANQSSTASVTVTVSAGVTYEVGVFVGGTTDTGGYTLSIAGDVTKATQITSSEATGSISGDVYNDANADGSQDNGEIGLSGWSVYVDVNNTGTFADGDPITTTDANGAFTFTGLTPGGYVVRVEAQNGYDASTATSSAVTVTAGQDVTATGFGESGTSTGQITGNVYADSNNDSNQDNGEPGLAGWYVYIDDNKSGQYADGDRYVQTDANGNYTFSGLQPGTYRVQIYPTDGYNTTEGSEGWDAPVTAGQTTTGAVFGEAQGSAALSGTVYNDSNGDGTLTSGETGLQGWTVYLDLNNTGTYASGDPTATTDANGTYTFSGIQPGQYTVRLQTQSGWSTTQGDTGWIGTATAGTTGNGGPFGETQATGSIYGFVYRDSNNNGTQDYYEGGISNWAVYLDLDNSGTYTDGVDTYVTTNSNGAYEFTGLAAGTYTVRAYAYKGWRATEGSSGWLGTVYANDDTYSGSFGER